MPWKLKSSRYLGAIFAHFVEPDFKYPFVEAIKRLSKTRQYLSKISDIQIVTKFDEITEKKVNIILGVEGGHIFDNTAKQIEILYSLGVRVFTLTWNNSNKLGHSAVAADKKGITKKGRQFLKEISNYDVIIDLSHASTRTVLDVCELCANQVIASHSCLRALNPQFLRNIDNQAIKAIVQRKGVIGINFSQRHLGSYGILEHIDYLKNNYGSQVPAIGSDFDGIDDAVITSPGQLAEVEKELKEKNYSKEDIGRIFAGNFMEVFKKM